MSRAEKLGVNAYEQADGARSKESIKAEVSSGLCLRALTDTVSQVPMSKFLPGANIV
jgi:hypothetical protein